MPRTGKTETLNLRIDPELKAAAERAAEADRRSLTAYIEKLIEDDVAARGPQPRRSPPRR
jgi:predicted HicB family RNase H-like nuclease